MKSFLWHSSILFFCSFFSSFIWANEPLIMQILSLLAVNMNFNHTKDTKKMIMEWVLPQWHPLDCCFEHRWRKQALHVQKFWYILGRASLPGRTAPRPMYDLHGQASLHFKIFQPREFPHHVSGWPWKAFQPFQLKTGEKTKKEDVHSYTWEIWDTWSRRYWF